MLMLSGGSLGAGRKVDAERAFRPLRQDLDAFAAQAKAVPCKNVLAQYAGYVDAYNDLLAQWGRGDAIMASRLAQVRAQIRARCHK